MANHKSALKRIRSNETKKSLNSDPKHPEFILIPPPTEPGIQDKNSKPDKPFSQAKSETFLSKDEQPAILSLIHI